jgi:WhiB family redox-sensing transcriptional regulator
MAPPSHVTAAERFAWQGRAACRDMDIRLFYGVEGEGLIDRRLREHDAKRVCADCPVRQDCLDEAVRNGTSWGVWGGLNGDGIDAERRRRARRAA